MVLLGMSLGTHVTGGTHWELDGNIAIKQKIKLPLGLWKGGRCFLSCSIFLKRYPLTLKFSVFSFQGGFFNKSRSRSFNSVIKSEAVSGHAGFTRIGPMLSLKWAHYAGQAHGPWSWTQAWPLGFYPIHKKE